MLTAFSNHSVLKAAQALKSGKLVSFPTETVYGLGADATNDKAVATIYAAKGRPSFNPLIAHVSSIAHAQKFGVFTKTAEKLTDAFWPGALTIVVPLVSDSGISKLVTAGLDTIALRMPSSPIARSLITHTDRPIAAPSANKSGSISPTLAQHVYDNLDDVCAYILDGGACEAGVESTIIDCSKNHPIILRPGPVTREMILEICPDLDDSAGLINDARPNAPGQLTSHYSPSKPVRLDVKAPVAGEIYIGFGKTPVASHYNLSPSGDVVEAAANLFAMLHEADKQGGDAIAIAPIAKDGIGAAIYDRLSRAAAKK